MEFATAREKLFLAASGDALRDRDGNDYVSAIVKRVAAARDAQRKKGVVSGVSLKAKPASDEFVAKGGFGSVYRAILFVAGVPVPVVSKVIRAACKSRGTDTLNEIVVMQSVAANSDWLMPALHIDLNPRTSDANIALPLGITDLGKVVRCIGKPFLKECTARRWSAEIARAIAELHARGVVHGDVKPGNVVLFPISPDPDTALATSVVITTLLAIFNSGGETEENLAHFAEVLDKTNVRLSDFGLASFVSAEDGYCLERSGDYAFTTPYRPPEVWDRNAWTYSADIWALGCTVYEIFTGKMAFVETERGALAGASVHKKRDSYFAAFERFAKAGDFVDGVWASSAPPTRPICVTAALESVTAPIHDAITFLGCTIRLSPDERISAADALTHPLVCGYAFSPKAKGSIPHSPRAPSPSPSSPAPSPASSPASSVSAEDIADAAAIAAPSDGVVRDLAVWLSTRVLDVRHRSKSVRIRRLGVKALVGICACIAAKVMRRRRAVEEAVVAVSRCEAGENLAVPGKCFAPPSAARDERAICQMLGFDLFAFSRDQHER